MSKYLIVNFDKKQYISPNAFGERDDLQSVVRSQEGVMLGLTVLLADGNNRGGGDLRSDAAIIGSWAGDRVALIDETVTDRAFSEPGMGDVPLQQQMLTLGKDVSPLVIEAIKEGEGDDAPVALLSQNLLLSPVEQRDLPGRALQYYATFTSRSRKPLVHLEDVFAVLGVSLGWSPARAKERLQEGLRKTALAFGRAERYAVHSLAYTYALKAEPATDGRHLAPARGVARIRADLVDESRGLPVDLDLKLGVGGSTLSQFFDQVFPGIAFEKAPPMAANVQSPAVRHLLSMIPGLEG